MAKHPQSDSITLPLRQFGKRVRELRQAKGMSQEQLADASGLDRSYIGGVERGQRNVSLLNITKIAVALDVPPKDLLESVKKHG